MSKQEVKQKGTAKGLAKTKNAIISAFDENENGEIDIVDVIAKGLRVPGIKINRDEFLEKQLFKRYPKEVIDVAIAESPMKAHIPVSEIDKIADEVIKFERTCVSGISAVLGIPGGWAMVATLPADIIQYYGYLLRATQKLLYLYGFPQINIQEQNGKFDDETMNTIILCLGVMHSVAGANKVLKLAANSLAVGVEKKLLKLPLTKGFIYPMVKEIASWFGKTMNKKIFAGFFRKAIPVVGGVLGGGITYVSFKPCCKKLKGTLRDTILSNPDYKVSLEEASLVKEFSEHNPQD